MTISIKSELSEPLQQFARERGLSIEELINFALESWVDIGALPQSQLSSEDRIRQLKAGAGTYPVRTDAELSRARFYE